MKNDREMYQSVLSRRGEYRRKKQSRMRMLRRTVPVLACLGIMLGIGVWTGIGRFSDLPDSPSIAEESVTVTAATALPASTAQTAIVTTAATTKKASAITVTSAVTTAVQSKTATAVSVTASRSQSVTVFTAVKTTVTVRTETAPAVTETTQSDMKDTIDVPDIDEDAQNSEKPSSGKPTGPSGRVPSGDEQSAPSVSPFEKEEELRYKLIQLLYQGDLLKYGEALYTTGTPEGILWYKDYYDQTVAYYGRELLDNYIVNGEFLKDKVENDIAALEDIIQSGRNENVYP